MRDPRRRGRPALDASTPSVKVCLTLTAKTFDAVQQRAQRERVSMPEVIRRELKNLKLRR